MENEPPVGAETALPISSDMRFSMDFMSSSLETSDDLQLSRKLLASRSACRKFGGYAGELMDQNDLKACGLAVSGQTNTVHLKINDSFFLHELVLSVFKRMTVFKRMSVSSNTNK